ncbi:hypothetical protein VUR80DRAFT_3687 [Thermomyces stellatus]
MGHALISTLGGTPLHCDQPPPRSQPPMSPGLGFVQSRASEVLRHALRVPRSSPEYYPHRSGRNARNVEEEGISGKKIIHKVFPEKKKETKPKSQDIIYLLLARTASRKDRS